MLTERVGPEPDYSVRTWYARWMEVYKCGVRDSTRANYSRMFLKHIDPVLGEMKLKEVAVSDVQALLNKMHISGYRSGVCRQVRALLVDLFQKAIQDDYAHKNPARAAYVRRERRSERRVLSRDEQITFFHACRGTFYEDLFTVAVLTGLRPGELFALTVRDIDWNHRTISVNKTLLYQKMEGDAGKQYHLHPPKTDGSFRTVVFDGRCAQALMRQTERKTSLVARQTSTPIPGLEDLLFVTARNTPLNTSTYYSAIQAVVRQINLNSDSTFQPFSGHCFRHTYATRCFEAGVDPKVIQKQLGHASLAMTMDLYAHLLDDKKRDELRKLDRYSETLF